MGVSIVITSYNQRDLLEDAIRGALDQTTPAQQIVVADDASTDDTHELLDELESTEPVVTVVRQRANLGISDNRNAGLEAANGDLVVFVDGDDVLDPTYVEVMARAIGADAGLAAYANFRRLELATGDVRPRWAERQPSGDVFSRFAYGQQGVTRTMLAPTDVVRRVGGLDRRFPKHDGLVLSIRVAKEVGFVYVDDCVMTKREHAAGDSRSFSDFERLGYLRDVATEIQRETADLPPADRAHIHDVWKRRLARVAARTQTLA